MLTLKRMPVTLYQSSDAEAPQLTATAGSLKTILEACLISGYGEKQALGWSMPFSDGQQAAFKSASPDATGFFLHLHHHLPRAADINAYHNMTDLNAGETSFAFDNKRFPFMSSYTQKVKWWLIGHAKAFWLIIEDSYNRNASQCLFFGDFPSYLAGDKAHCGLLHSGWRSSSSYTTLTTSFSVGLAYERYYSLAIARSWDGLNAPAFACLNGRYQSLTRMSYPDPITQGMYADSIDILEKSGETIALRGQLPGLHHCPQNLSALEEGTAVDGFALTEDVFLKFRLENSTSNGGFVLLNASAWLA